MPAKHGPRRNRDRTLTDAERVSIRERVLALPPLTDEQLDALGDAVADIELATAKRKAAAVQHDPCRLCRTPAKSLLDHPPITEAGALLLAEALGGNERAIEVAGQAVLRERAGWEREHRDHPPDCLCGDSL